MKNERTPNTYNRHPLACTSYYPNAYAAAVKAEKRKEQEESAPCPAWPMAYHTGSPYAYAAAVKEAKKAYRSDLGGYIARPSA